jgi:hypothetical protein
MKWIKMTEKRPRCCDNVLFTDGDQIFCGWMETLDKEEDAVFYDAITRETPENVTHWYPFTMLKLPT